MLLANLVQPSILEFPTDEESNRPIFCVVSNLKIGERNPVTGELTYGMTELLRTYGSTIVAAPKPYSIEKQ